MSSKQPKQEQDFSALVDAKIPEYRKLALESNNLPKAIENLLAIEKQTRQGGDAPSTAKILETVVDLCYQLKAYKELKENILLLSKRRGQLKAATKRMVKKAMTFLPHLDYDNKMTLLDTLMQVTEGKIFVEKQSARLTLMLAHIREQEGKIGEAATILQEVQVETFGSMKKKEKTEYILEQMRLCLLKKDYIRAQIMSRKINPKVLDDKDFQESRITYHTLMMDYYHHEHNYLNIFRSIQAIYNTPIIQADPNKWQKYLKLSVVYIVLAPYGNEQNDLINRLALDKNLNELAVFKEFLKSFITMEIMYWKEIGTFYKPELDKLELFQSPKSEKLWHDLHERVTEHNIRTVAKYYSKITLQRLSELLDLDLKKTEKHLCDLVINKSIFARINRPEGTVNFIKRQEAADALNDWSSDISSLLGLVEKTCHLINRENMVHGIETN